MARFNKTFQIATLNDDLRAIIARSTDGFSTTTTLNNVAEQSGSAFDDTLTKAFGTATVNGIGGGKLDWHSMTGSDASFEPTASTLNDTIFSDGGVSWASIQAGMIGHTGSSNSLIKGYAGYETKISYLSGGEDSAALAGIGGFQIATPATKNSLGVPSDEHYMELTNIALPITFGTNLTTTITATIQHGVITETSDVTSTITGDARDEVETKISTDYSEGTPVVLAVDETNFLASSTGETIDRVNYLIPGYIRINSYTSSVPLQKAIKFYTLREIGGAMSYNLGQTIEALQDTTFKKARNNSGYMTYTHGLRTITNELSGLYEKENSDILFRILESRTPIVVEIRPKGDNNIKGEPSTFVRGTFYLTGLPQSGSVGQLEEQQFRMNLFVRAEGAGGIKLLDPFRWYINSNEVGNANEVLINAYRSNEHIAFRYSEDGTNIQAKYGIAMITDFSLSGGLDEMNRFTVNLTGCDKPVII